MDVARVSLREAIGQLKDEGYLSARRGSAGGTFVTALERPYEAWLKSMRSRLPDFDDMQDFRIAIECHAATLAASRITRDEIRSLQDSVDRIGSCCDATTFRRVDTDFHLGIAAASGSQRLLAATQSVRIELFAPTDLYGFTPRAETSAYWHKIIFDALRAGDGEGASKAMEQHIEHTRRELREVLGMEDS